MIIRPATAMDLAAVTGCQPPMSCRALVAEEDGQTRAVFGVYAKNTRYIMFSHLTDEFRANKRAMVIGIRALWDLIKGRPAMPVLAHADPAIKGSDVLLLHMGFEPLHEGIYQCPGLKPSRPSSR